MPTNAPPADRKPIDVGDGRLVASFAASRPALLSLTCHQPRHGIAELCAAPPFDESLRGDPDEIRGYRQLLAGDDHPCLELETAGGQPLTAVRLEASNPERPRWHGAIGATAGAALQAEAFADGDGITLRWEIPQAAPGLRLRFRGRFDRPAMAEITELDPPEPTGSSTTLTVDGPRLIVQATLPAAMLIDTDTGSWVVDGDEAVLDVGLANAVSVRLRTLDDLPRGRGRASGPPAVDLGVAPDTSRIVDRALAYTRGCAAITTAADEVAILADHRLLPLSWTRDAYYQAFLLLATGFPADADLVADHLRWLWRRCERPDGRWLRSHHANGRPKDLAFQADQQLYPLLELADYWRARADLPDGVDWSAEVRRAWSATTAEVDDATGLIATTENAADDPAIAPYVAGSQILLWYVSVRLAELADAGALDINAGLLRALAASAKDGFDRHLVDGDRWLYATDAQSVRVDYHDANDLPVALAPLLGFCSADDPGWRGTMDFAFSAANPGYFDGERGGLGSAHTAAAWTLGDVQAWIRARAVGDEGATATAVNRLSEVAFHDGMLPEAYSASREPDERIRHWFAWPGAVFGALVLLDARGELDALRPRSPEPP